jgi:hypothetical protein
MRETIKKTTIGIKKSERNREQRFQRSSDT